MSRASKTDHSSAVSLFPFLAVLLCTMGALVVLLVAMSHVSRSQRELASEALHEEPGAAERIERMAQIVAYQTRADKQQAVLTDQLQSGQKRLRHLEDHIRRMHDQLASLKIALAELQQIDEEHFDDRSQAQRELQRLRELIEQTKQEIEQLEAERDKQAKSYSIVPYKGKSGTTRRPVYIECRKDRVIMQPEGVELTPEDFTPPLGVGNPLAAVLRSAKEYYARLDGGDGYDPQIEPYPLLIVRPDGIADYYRVREAIRAWDSDFGYELVNADWTLAYPTPNPDLAAAEQQALDGARMRREMLARAMPRAYGGGGSGQGGSGYSTTGRGGAGEPYDREVLGANSGGSGTGELAMNEGQIAGSMGEGSGKGSAAESPAGGPASGGSAEQTGEGKSEADRYAAQAPRQQPGGTSGVEGDQRTEHSAAEQGKSPASTQSSTAASGSMANTAKAAAGGGGGSPNNSSGSPSQGSASASFEMNRNNSSGGSPRSGVVGPDVVTIRRPVRLFVEQARVSLVPEEGRAKPFADSQNNAETFAKAIRGEIDSWGAAGHGLSWRPVVTLSASPDGVARAGELATLLRRMGLDVSYDDGAPSTASNAPPEASRGTR